MYLLVVKLFENGYIYALYVWKFSWVNIIKLIRIWFYLSIVYKEVFDISIRKF